ncbi:unnamed protein product [Ceratitis capitata]|uniref:(Mediterranean fruit fly) hypothetical protein n=1 Tax=Ceratitis capitata TaxID=7213 RepID=A0A811UTU3_CERCA|nr:unnamed protein product [Ceratitis capitata]
MTFGVDPDTHIDSLEQAECATVEGTSKWSCKLTITGLSQVVMVVALDIDTDEYVNIYNVYLGNSKVLVGCVYRQNRPVNFSDFTDFLQPLLGNYKII